ncbi:hypothetical protein SLA2020_264710 [Shorea laevis]
MTICIPSGSLKKWKMLTFKESRLWDGKSISESKPQFWKFVEPSGKDSPLLNVLGMYSSVYTGVHNLTGLIMDSN